MRVDEHERVVAVEQLVGEVHPRIPKSRRRVTPSGIGRQSSRRCARRPRRRSRRRRGRCCRCRRRARVVRAVIAAPRSRRGGSTGSGPATSSSRSPGSSSSVTATCSSPSTSCEHTVHGGEPAGEEHVVRVGPPRRLAGAPWCRVPTSTPPITHVSVNGSNDAVDRRIPPRRGDSVRSSSATRRRLVGASGPRRAGAPRSRAACRRSGR